MLHQLNHILGEKPKRMHVDIEAWVNLGSCMYDFY